MSLLAETRLKMRCRQLFAHCSGSLVASTVITCFVCLWATGTHATETVCQKKAESLGWAISCGCLKHDLSIVQDNLSLLLPNCQSEDSETLAKDVANGQKKAADHQGEYNFLCMLSCKSANWNIVNKRIGGRGI
jgi:hypothetical protein